MATAAVPGPGPSPAHWEPNKPFVCLRYAATDFTQQSTLHGLRYISDRSLSRVERYFWVVAFVVAFVLAAHFITNVYLEWMDRPVIMSLSPHTTELKDIPFPAVTICNVNYVKKSIALDILHRAKAEGSKGFIERKHLNDYCKNPQNPADSNIDESGISWTEVEQFMLRVSQPCREMLVACYWHSEKYDCNQLFHSSLTDEGFCCSFNLLHTHLLFNNPKNSSVPSSRPFKSVDWSPQNGFPKRVEPYTVPWRPWGAGSHMGLRVVLDADLNEYFCSSELSTGFKVVIHNPVEVPKTSAFASVLQPGLETRMAIDPLIWLSNKEHLHRVPMSKRNCIFAYEKNLTFFRTYTQHNCALECETKFTLEACECVLSYMPKNESIRVCGRKDMECAAKALKAMEVLLMDDGDLFELLSSENMTEACGCKPGCFAVSYQKKISTAKLWSKKELAKEFLAGKDTEYFSTNMAVLNVFFTETQFTATYRSQLYTFTDFLANTGGLLGLFMGFSFLSAVEAFYFLTLRLWCSLILRRHEFQRPPPPPPPPSPSTVWVQPPTP